MALIINARPQMDIPASRGGSSGLDDALASAVEQLYKKKSKPEDLAVPMAVFAAPPIVLQDKTVRPGGAGSVTGQVQLGDTISAGKAQKNLVLTAVAGALQFSASPQTGRELPLKLPLNATPQSPRDVGAAQPVTSEVVKLVQPAQGTEFTSIADTAHRLATLANPAFSPVLPSQLTLNAATLTAQMARPTLSSAAEFASIMSSVQAIPERGVARSGTDPVSALMRPLVEHATPQVPGTPAEFAQLAQSAQIVGTTAKNMAQDTRPNALSNTAAAPSLKAADLPLQATPEPKTIPHTSGTSVGFMPSQQPAQTLGATAQNMAQDTMLSALSNTAAVPSLNVADLPLLATPESRSTLHTSGTSNEFMPSQPPAQVARASTKNAMPSTLPNVTGSLGAAAPSESAPWPMKAALVQEMAELGAVDSSVEFTPVAPSVQLADASPQNSGKNAMPNTLLSKVMTATSASADLPLEADPVQITTPRTSGTSVEFTTAQQRAKTHASAQNRVLNSTPNGLLSTVVASSLSTDLTSQATLAQITTSGKSDASIEFTPSRQVAQKGAPESTSAQFVFGKEAELLKANFSLSEKSGAQSMKQEISEITSALPTMLASSGQPAQQISPVLPQEQAVKTHTGAKQHAEVLAIRDKNAAAPKGTEVSFLGGKLTFSPSEAGGGVTVRASEDHKKILMSYGEVPAGIDSVESSIDSVESSTDKQSKGRSKNQNSADNADK